VRAEVHDAVVELLDEVEWDELSIPLIAARSGVHPSTIYRRWGTVSGVIDDVVSEELARLAPVPDTGSLREDLESYAVLVAENVAGPLGALFLRAAALGMRADRSSGVGQAHRPALPSRTQEIRGMLDRASERGEVTPTLQELFEVVMAPIYLQALFFNQPVDPDHARMLVSRLLDLVERERSGR
jgi:AcrR family transcriptional regulator